MLYKTKSRILPFLLIGALLLSVSFGGLSPARAAGADAKWQQVDSLLDHIAASYTDSADPWQVMDMTVYNEFMPAAAQQTSGSARQSFINSAVAAVDDKAVTNNDLAKYIITLKSIGVDAAKLYTPSGSDSRSVDATAKLRAVSITSLFEAPWALLAEMQGNLHLSDTQIRSLVQIIKDNQGNGLFGYQWDGVTYDDPDTAGTVLAALAPYYLAALDPWLVKDDVTAIVDKSLAELSSAQLASGSFGNSNTDAAVILGLLALGIDPDGDSRFIKGTNSLLDGLLSYALADESGFGWSDNSAINGLSSEQGFRALIATVAFKTNNNSAFNIYDFSANRLAAEARADDGQGTSESSDGGNPSSGTKITVYFTLQGLDSNGRETIWINKKAVSGLPDEATIADVIIKALEGTGYSQMNAARGYIKSVTTPAGVTLSEMQDPWPNSGWLFKINYQLPSAGIDSCRVENGDQILLYFTKDFTKDPDAGSYSESSAVAETEETNDDEAAEVAADNRLESFLTLIPEAVTKDGVTTYNVTAEQISAAVAKALNNTAEQLADPNEFAEFAGIIVTVDGTGLEKTAEVRVALDPAALGRENVSLRIITPDGAQVDCSAALLQEMGGLLQGEITVALLPGSLTVSIIRNDQPVDWHSRKNPLLLSLPGSAGQLLADKLNGGHLIARSWYKEGRVYGKVDGTGTYELKAATLRNFTDTVAPGMGEAADYLWERSVINGVDGGLFAPQLNVTRGEFITMLMRSLDSGSVPRSVGPAEQFSDVPEGSFCYDSLLKAKTLGITCGVGENRFEPDAAILRQDMFLMLYNAMEVWDLIVQAENSQEPDRFTDTAEIADYAKQAILTLMQNHTVGGADSGILQPQDTVTRAEAAQVIYNMLLKDAE